MKNPLHKELEDLRYISISSIDPYDIPESVVIYFKNNSEINKKMSIETIHGIQLDLQNQNPTIVLENYKATFCLGSTPYVPTVTIDPIEDILDPEYPRKITFTGTVSRTDDYIPNDILVEYNGVTTRASLVDDTHWSVTYDLIEVTEDTDQVVSAKANSIDVNNPEMDGEFSLPVEETFKILFTVIDCIPVNDKVSCLCLDVTKNYKVTVDGQSITGTFEEVVAFLDSHGLYAYPGGLECDPCAESTNKFTTTVIRQLPPGPIEAMNMMAIEDSTTAHVFTVIDNGVESTIEYPKFLYSYDLFEDIMRGVEDISIVQEGIPGRTITSYKNLSDQKREIQFIADSEDAIKALGKIEFDDFSRTLEYTGNTFKLCLLGTQPVTCQSSTSPVAAFDTLPMMENGSITVNGISYTVEQLSQNLTPFGLEGDMYGIRFVNRTEECLLIEITYEGEELFFPQSTTLGIESESAPGIFRLSLAPQVFEPIQVSIEFKDKQSGYAVSGELIESAIYEVSISALSNNPDPNWRGKVTYNGEEYELVPNYNNRIQLDVAIPANKTWISHPYVYDFDVTSDFEFTYEGGSKPAFNVSYQMLDNPTSTWKYGVYSELVQNSFRHSYDAKNTYSKSDILTVQFDPIYAGLTTGEPFNATVNSSGLLTIDLSKSYPYNSGWTTDWKIRNYLNLKNSEGSQVASLSYYVSLDTFRVERESKEFPGSYSYTTEINQKVNTPFTKFRFGPLPDVTKVSLTVHQDGSSNAALVRDTTILDVVDNYAYYTPPTPTQTYSPYVNDPNWPINSYRVTMFLIRVVEGNSKYITWMKQSPDLKYVVSE